MKIALCFYGQPRLLNNPYVYISHKYWILDRYNTDIFIHSWIDNEEKEFNYADQVKIKSKEIKNSDQIILNRYKPKKYIFEKSKVFKLDENQEKILKYKESEQKTRWSAGSYFNLTENNVNNHLSQLYSLSQSIKLIDDDYDWVILSRFDNYIINIPDLCSLNNDDLYLDNKYYDVTCDVNNFTDVLMIGGLEQIKSFNIFDKLNELIYDIEAFQPEEFKRVAYYKKYKHKIKEYSPNLKLPIKLEKRIKIRVGVVRTNSLENLQT
jgi:hypothetical protein